MHTKALPYIGLLSFFWGTNTVVGRFGVGEVDPFVFIALRLTVAMLCFVLFFSIQVHWRGTQRWSKDRNVWIHGAISGTIGLAIPTSLFMLSLQYLSSGVASIFVATAPAVMVIAAHLFLPDEKMTVNKAMGVLLALVGSLFLILRGESGLDEVANLSSLGFLLLGAAILFETSNAMFIRRRMREMDPVQVTGIRLIMGSVITLFMALFAAADLSLGSISAAGGLSILYSALIGALGGQFLSFFITRRFGATAFSLTTYLMPVVATTLGIIFLDEIFTYGMLLGVILIVGGIYLINRQRTKQTTPATGAIKSN